MTSADIRYFLDCKLSITNLLKTSCFNDNPRVVITEYLNLKQKWKHQAYVRGNASFMLFFWVVVQLVIKHLEFRTFSEWSMYVQFLHCVQRLNTSSLQDVITFLFIELHPRASNYLLILWCLTSYDWWWCTMWATHAHSPLSLGPLKWSLRYVTIALFGNHYIIQHLYWLVFATLRHLKYVIRGTYCIMPMGQYTRFANRFCQFKQVLRCKVKHCSK